MPMPLSFRALEQSAYRAALRADREAPEAQAKLSAAVAPGWGPGKAAEPRPSAVPAGARRKRFAQVTRQVACPAAAEAALRSGGSAVSLGRLARAASPRASKAARLRLVDKLAVAAGAGPLKMDGHLARHTGDALVDSGYPSAHLYLADAVHRMLKRARDVGAGVRSALADVKRAAKRVDGRVARGMLPRLEALSETEAQALPLVPGGPRHPRAACLVVYWCLLRNVSLVDLDRAAVLTSGANGATVMVTSTCEKKWRPRFRGR